MFHNSLVLGQFKTEPIYLYSYPTASVLRQRGRKLLHFAIKGGGVIPK